MTLINHAIENYLTSLQHSHSEHTIRSYTNALAIFILLLREQGKDPVKTPVSSLDEKYVGTLVTHLKDFSSATERLYLTAVRGFYEYICAEHLAGTNLANMRSLARQGARHSTPCLPKFYKVDIERLLVFVTDPTNRETVVEAGGDNGYLRAQRDVAFLLTLADTGLRVHEACALRREDIHWNEGRAIIIGKGDKEAVVRFSTRAMRALREYLAARATLDGGSGRPLGSLPLFARHDKGAGKKVKPITTTTGRNIVAERVEQILGKEAVGKITPHSFRHYFVTTVLRGSGDLKLAQELARHKNIQVTQRYAHLSDDELDKGYYEIFEGKD